MRNQLGWMLAGSLWAAPFAIAQHDLQRDAVRHIARGEFDQAAARLASGKKPDSGPAETLFVEMLGLLARDEIEGATAKAREALAQGLPPGRLAAGPRELLRKLPPLAEAEAIDLVHGPMLGSLTTDSVSVWVRTREAAEVGVAAGPILATAKTGPETDFTAVLELEGLEPNTAYDGQVSINGEPVEGAVVTFRTPPTASAPKPFTVAFGGGAGFIPEWERMWDTILARKPMAFLTLGDNVYIDDPEHPLTHHYCYSRRQSRPEWRRLTSATAVYSIWDDHDFGMNDCIPGPEIETPAWKREVWNIFRQNWANPGYGGGTDQPGCWYDFHLGDVHFIMIDGRYYRDLKGGSMLGPVQKAWLKKTLTESKGTFKVIASNVPFTPNIKKGSRDPWDGYPEERAEIFSWIPEHDLDGVFLIAADRHRTDLRTIDNPGSYPLYEFQSSKLTNKHTHPVVQTEGLLWGYNKTCSFGLMHFDTTLDDPQVRFELVDIDGKVHEDHTLRLSELKAD
ncbi:alkaline phosphatase D family protein [Haloferula sp. A504]|uniref:alkaline phosphatase D family protein n=1 Tax=Haloferula sp. A504 TaxID=3373601 RepID=UPI0031C316EE|nr:alkaline phosphatase D family protein [Verrucomicrobiaceae bacterium E54]